MGKNLFDTRTVTLSELLGNGKTYKVPLYQRDYSWREEHWEELWEDIYNIKDKNGSHYMGSIVLQNAAEDKTYSVIDGQQRLATLSIMVLAAIKILKELTDKDSKNKQREEILFERFLGSQDAVSLRRTNKLHLNETNNNFYSINLINLETPVNKSKLNESDKLLWECLEFFIEKIRNDKKIGEDGEKIALFIDKIVAEKLIFIQITVEDDLSAYIVFETLNARGIELTSTDLLKNFLFAMVKSDTDRLQINTYWKRITGIIGVREFPQFLRHYINSRQPLVRKEELFKRIKSTITKNTDVFDLIRELEKAADIYNSFEEPEDEKWNDNEKKFIKELLLFRVVQPKPLLLTCFLKLKTEEFDKVLRDIIKISFRYNIICGLNPNLLEDAYNKAAVKVYNGVYNSAREVFNDLNSAGIYVNDGKFTNSFLLKTFENSKSKNIVKYILLSIDNFKSGKSYDPLAAEPATIEHILPENPLESWYSSFNKDSIEEWIYRLGNLAVIEPKLNKRMSNSGFEEKKSIYPESIYQLTKELSEYEDWTKNTITRRQQMFAEAAKGIWSIIY